MCICNSLFLTVSLHRLAMSWFRMPEALKEWIDSFVSCSVSHKLCLSSSERLEADPTHPRAPTASGGFCRTLSSAKR